MESGLTTVFSPQNINVTLGWNTLVLTTAYEWDGLSNLVIEICYDNLISSYTYNWGTPVQQTTFTSTLYFNSDIIPACPYLLIQTPSNRRPVTRFTTCPTVPNPANFTYQWTPTTNLSNSTVPNPYALPVVTTTYTVVVTDTNGGCTDTASVTIDVLCDTCLAPIPTLTNVSCFGGNDGSILAHPSGVDGPPWLVELLDPITFGVLQSDNNVSTNTLFSGLVAGTYVVRSTDTASCYADTLVTITSPLQVTQLLSNDTIICIGGTANISSLASGGTPPYTYNWNGIVGNGPHLVSPLISEYYSVTVVDSLGCNSSDDSILVAINPPILLTISLDDTVCPGGTATLSILATGGGVMPYNYIWTESLSGIQVGNTSTVDVIPPSDPYMYYVTVSDNCETPAVTDSLMIYWYQEPQVSFITSDNIGCYPVEATFTNTTPSSQVSTCLWDFGDGNYSIDCGVVNHTYNIPGFYTVTLTVTSPEFCVNDTIMTDLVVVYDYPDASFTATPNPTDILNPNVSFIDNSTSDVISYSWSFIDSQLDTIGTSIDQNPTISFPNQNSGVYNVLLSVQNANGCIDTTLMQVVVNGVFTCYLPNTFTPDGDGLNDFFFVMGQSISADFFSFVIFDRWGEKVFETDDINAKWDGSFRSQPAQEDIYVWKIDSKNIITGEIKEFTGHVMLMR